MLNREDAKARGEPCGLMEKVSRKARKENTRRERKENTCSQRVFDFFELATGLQYVIPASEPVSFRVVRIFPTKYRKPLILHIKNH